MRRRGLLNNRPGMTGLDPEALKAVLDRHNVTVVLTHRANALKEALSWYRARERGVSQFHREQAAAPVHVDLSTFLHGLRYVEQTNRALRTAVSSIVDVARQISRTDRRRARTSAGRPCRCCTRTSRGTHGRRWSR